MPRVLQVIESEISRGEGRDADDVCRTVVEYHSLDGTFLAERDTFASFNSIATLARANLKPEQLRRLAAMLAAESSEK